MRNICKYLAYYLECSLRNASLVSKINMDFPLEKGGNKELVFY